jgi:hypothetical protein
VQGRSGAPSRGVGGAGFQRLRPGREVLGSEGGCGVKFLRLTQFHGDLAVVNFEHVAYFAPYVPQSPNSDFEKELIGCTMVRIAGNDTFARLVVKESVDEIGRNLAGVEAALLVRPDPARRRVVPMTAG